MTFSAVLLAGGESRRMRSDKATMLFRGAPLWQKQFQTLQDLAPEKIFISVRSKPTWLPSSAEPLLDQPPSRGPLSGLANAIERMQTTHVVVLAVDMPLMTADFLRWMCEFPSNGAGLVPMIDGQPEPLAAVYPKEAAELINQALGGSDFSMQQLVRNLVGAGKVRMFEVPPGRRVLFQNLNTPEEGRNIEANWSPQIQA